MLISHMNTNEISKQWANPPASLAPLWWTSPQEPLLACSADSLKSKVFRAKKRKHKTDTVVAELSIGASFKDNPGCKWGVGRWADSTQPNGNKW